MKRQRCLNWFTLGYAQVAVIFPVVVVSPRYFARQIGLGSLMQVVNAFSFVQNSLSFIINSYSDIAALLAVTQRLSGFEERLLAVQKSIHAPRRIIIRNGGGDFAVNEVNVDLPNGTPLLQGVAFAPARRGILHHAPPLACCACRRLVRHRAALRLRAESGAAQEPAARGRAG
jgi:putative ATP-binding cassette transporter